MLAAYENDARYLLRDTGQNPFIPTAQLDRWINTARRTAVKLTGCIRELITGQSPYGAMAQPGNMTPGAIVPGMLPDNDPGAGLASTNSFMTIPNVELYPFDFGNQYLRQQTSGLDGIIDVIDVAVSWGASRPALDWWPWDELQAYARSYNVETFSYPGIFSTNGDGERAKVWLFPGPSTATEMEWDVFALPAILANDSSPEAIPPAFREAIKYGAASLALLNSRPQMAAVYYQQFLDSLGVSRLTSDRGKTGSYYWFN